MMNLSRDLLRKVLFEQHQQVLEKSLGIERTILTDLSSKLSIPHILIITGLRRVGKSTLLRQIMEHYYPTRNFYYITFEDERLKNFPSSEFNLIYEILLELFGTSKTFFIDEIQNINDFESFVRRFYDQGFKFIITGSNASLLTSEISTKLTGRHINIYLKPFSFKEFLLSRQIQIPPSPELLTETRALMQKNFDDYMVMGGIPEYIIYHQTDMITHLFEDIVIKDIIARKRVNETRILRELYAYLITNICQSFSYTRLTKIIGLNSINTTRNYIEYLEESYLGALISKYDFSIKKQLINEKKFYMLDNGFIKPLTRRIMPDKGWLLENLVFSRLWGQNIIYYFSGKKECDFITVFENKITGVYQVCIELTPQNEMREIGGLIECMNYLKLKEGWILTTSQTEERKIDDLLIHILPIWLWCLQND